MSKLSKRAGPDPVEPVLIDGIRIEAVHWGKGLGSGQNGGYIAAYDTSTGERLWTLQVYQTDYDRQRERDVQDVFISHLSVNEPGGELRVIDEEGREYIVNLLSRTVSKV